MDLRRPVVKDPHGELFPIIDDIELTGELALIVTASYAKLKEHTNLNIIYHT